LGVATLKKSDKGYLQEVWKEKGKTKEYLFSTFAIRIYLILLISKNDDHH